VRDARGFTLIELLLVLLILGVLLTISIANYRQARLRGAEASAIGSMSAINQAQYAYMQTCGNQVVKSGYKFLMEGTEVTDLVQTCTGDTPVEGYHVTADPVTPGSTGNRYFGTNVELVIYENLETFAGKMPDTGAPTIGQEAKGR
jgi:prepilin-type N-terminal cleavage/methylation domain-containing protein